ncbi:MAG: hypothetical protein U0V03_08765 [Bacteroidia bacterium]
MIKTSTQKLNSKNKNLTTENELPSFFEPNILSVSNILNFSKNINVKKSAYIKYIIYIKS